VMAAQVPNVQLAFCGASCSITEQHTTRTCTLQQLPQRVVVLLHHTEHQQAVPLGSSLKATRCTSNQQPIDHPQHSIKPFARQPRF